MLSKGTKAFDLIIIQWNVLHEMKRAVQPEEEAELRSNYRIVCNGIRQFMATDRYLG